MNTGRPPLITSVSMLAMMLALWGSKASSQTPAAPETPGEPLVGQSAPAGSAPANPAGQLEGPAPLGEIVVTARKTKERLNDVPISVSVASGDQLEKQGVIDATDLSKVASSFTYQQSSSGTPVLSIRGVGFLNQSVAASPTVSTYVDQVPLPFSINTKGAVLDLERVEVLEGPQGTTFGQNSTAGSVNFVAAKPTEAPHAAAEITYQRFDEVDAEGYLSGPITPNLTARISARTEQRFDGYQQTYVPGDERTNGEKNFLTGRLILDWKPVSYFRAELNVSGWRDRSDTPAEQFLSYAPLTTPGTPAQAAVLPTYPTAPADPRAAEFDRNFSLRDNENQRQISLRTDLDLGSNVTVTSITDYLALDVNLPIDLDGTSFPDLRIDSVSNVDTFSQELRFSNTRLSRLTWVIGANYENDNLPDNEIFTNYNVSNNAVGPFTYKNFRELNKQIVNTEAGFANGEFKITPTIAVQGGVRYTSQTRDFTGCFYDLGGGDLSTAFGFLSGLLSGTNVVIPPGGCVTLGANGLPVKIVHQSLDQRNVSWKAGVSWKPVSSTLLYADITKGYKSGAFDTLPLVLASEADPVTQEALTDYELGFKSTLVPRVWELNGSFFYYDYVNKQSQGFVETGVPFGNLPALITVPFSRVVGFEFNSIVRPFDGLQLTLGGTYANSEVTSNFVTPDPFGNSVNVKGDMLPDAPRFQFVGDIEYDFSVTSKLVATLGANSTYRTTSVAEFGGDPRLTIPSYGLIDLRAGISSSDREWSLLLFGRNVTNHLYPVTINRFGDFVSQTAGFPAVYGLTLKHKFF